MSQILRRRSGAKFIAIFAWLGFSLVRVFQRYPPPHDFPLFFPHQVIDGATMALVPRQGSAFNQGGAHPHSHLLNNAAAGGVNPNNTYSEIYAGVGNNHQQHHNQQQTPLPNTPGHHAANGHTHHHHNNPQSAPNKSPGGDRANSVASHHYWSLSWASPRPLLLRSPSPLSLSSRAITPSLDSEPGSASNKVYHLVKPPSDSGRGIRWLCRSVACASSSSSSPSSQLSPSSSISSSSPPS